MKHDDTSFIVNEEFSNICINFLVTIMSAMGRCYEVGHVCDRSLLRRRSRLSWAVAKMFVTVSMIMSVTPVGVGGSKFLPLYSSTLLLDRVSQNLEFFFFAQQHIIVTVNHRIHIFNPRHSTHNLGEGLASRNISERTAVTHGHGHGHDP